MKIYKACPEFWYDTMEAYYVKKQDAVDAVNDFMSRICKVKWAVRYHFIGTETNGDVICIVYDTATEHSISPIRTLPAIRIVELNGLEDET